MSSRKKTRKVGQIGVRKDPDFKLKRGNNKKTDTTQKSRKHSGNPSGSRNAVETKDVKGGTAKVKQDPRHGSKKPIQLIKAPVTKAEVKRYGTPAEELAALEADTKLSALLDKLDDDQAISKAEQHYVDEKMARHRILCDLLGITDTDEEDDDDDPLAHLDAYSMDEFKD